ncbi:hypothetical protein HYV30_01630 [Candidatus Kaiserbacteria bacterium]|nr:hypothetical protein [Candidatus Kaiserbacteria bacterium]
MTISKYLFAAVLMAALFGGACAQPMASQTTTGNNNVSASVPTAAEWQRMTGAELKSFEGKTFSSLGTRGQPYWIKLGPPDGITKFWASTDSGIPGHEDFRDQGVWWVWNNQFCLQYDSWMGGKASCNPIEHAGGKFRWAGSNKPITVE